MNPLLATKILCYMIIGLFVCYLAVCHKNKKVQRESKCEEEKNFWTLLSIRLAVATVVTFAMTMIMMMSMINN